MSRMLFLLHRLEETAVVLCFSLSLLMAVIQVAARNILHSGFAQADTMLRYAVLWLTMLGAMLVTREGRHINISLVQTFLSGRAEAGLAVITNGFAAGVCAVLARAAFSFVVDEYTYGQPAFYSLPSWAALSVLPFGFSVMALRFTLRTLAALRRTAFPPDPTTETVHTT